MRPSYRRGVRIRAGPCTSFAAADGRSPNGSPRPSTVFSRAPSAASGAAALSLSPELALAQRIADLPDPTKDLYPVKRNAAYVLDRPITDEKINNSYNNFYEFGSAKTIAKAAQALRLRPWTIKIDGMVEKAQEIGIDDLIRKMLLEERPIATAAWSAGRWRSPGPGFRSPGWWNWRSRCRRRHTCGWRPSQSFAGLGPAPEHPWPYVEGLTMAEATNELAFLVTGAYGKPVSKQMGAPLRLAVPWKYGFKSIKSIVRFHFTDQRPKSFWRRCRAPSTASGQTSIRRCRIRAGARQRRT